MRLPDRLPVLAALLVGIAGYVGWRHSRSPGIPAPGSTDRREQAARAFLGTEAREAELDRTHWAPELHAERFEDALVAFWDSLNASGHAWDTFAAQVPDTLVFPAETAAPPDGFADLGAPQRGRRLDAAGIRSWIATLRDAGWQARRSRWELRAHDAGANRSLVRFEILATNPAATERAQIRGEARVTWSGPDSPRPRSVAIERLEAWGLAGPTRFSVEATLDLPMPPHTGFADPLLAIGRGDGTAEVIAVGADLRYHRDGAGRWSSRPLADLPPERLWAAAVADWDDDGQDDLILAGHDGVRVLRGPEFDGPGQPVWTAPRGLLHPQVIAVGDYDGDGRPDLWVGQYKLPYQGGQFPTPYHDANDGFPSYLLHREGPSVLRDATEESGLGARRRRVYAGSFVDIDGDGDLDLLTTSDFAGLDVFENDGHGHFRERTAGLGDARMAFGMAHVSGDFDGDGLTDVFMAGMGSTVAARLESLGLGEPGDADGRRWRAAMTSGNRVFAGTREGLRAAGWARGLADAGWAWAVTPLDLDNDGKLDFHVCNGHETRAGTRDYERQFWRHDLHVGRSTNDPAADLYFRAAAGRRAADRASYGGWQHGACFRRDATGDFRDVGWLLGTSVFADTRNAVAVDFDGDGRMDLALTAIEEWPVRRQSLVILRNTGGTAGHWIGFRFDGCSGLNATVRITAAGASQQRRPTAGESFRSQASGAVHFGIGGATAVESAGIAWPDGSRQDLGRPAVDRWTTIRRAGR
ncbi:MAG: CRTAC1 family protein [Verrucomicrobia bacterium]|nr:MAG: CRTAC1 family protein [Verrucomicrobiota bacterium]